MPSSAPPPDSVEQLQRRIADLERENAALRQDAARFQFLADQSADVISHVDESGRFLYISPACRRLLGYEPPEIIDQNGLALIHADDLARIVATSQDDFLRREDTTIVYRMRHKDGRWIWVESHVRPVEPTRAGALREFLCNTRDVSARVEGEQALNRAYERYQLATASGGVVPWEADLNADVVESDRLFLEWLGIDPDAAPRTVEEWRPHHHPDEYDDVVRRFTALQRGEVDEVAVEYRMRHANGEYRWILSRGRAKLDAHGRRRIVGTVIDIDQRKRAEEALRASEERHRALVESSSQGILIVRGESVLYANPRAAEMFGCRGATELTERGLMPFVAHGNEERVRQSLDASRRGGAPPRATLWSGVRTDARRLWVESAATHIDWNGEPASLMLLADVSDRTQLEAQSLRVERMEAVGQLAAGIAHDFNNLLMVIFGHSEVLLHAIAHDGASRRHVEEIRRAGQRAAELVKQLLAFSRQSTLEVKVVDLNHVVAESQTMLRSLLGKDIELCCALAPRLEPTLADPGQLTQVLLNLAANARDAMPAGGRLTIETADVEITDVSGVADGAARPGRYVVLTVSDTGCGMSPEVQPRIFEPFFTTKHDGKGTGLGLATVYGIVRQSDGWIEVASQPDQGAQFRVFLPRADGAAVAPAPLEQAIDAPPRSAADER